MANTSTRVSRPEEEGVKRLVAMAGERDSGETCRTYVFKKENHTLGNALRSMLLTNPQVLFAGYTIPHPAEDQMHLRIQTAPDYLAQTALKKALVDLRALTVLTKAKFEEAEAKFVAENPGE